MTDKMAERVFDLVLLFVLVFISGCQRQQPVERDILQDTCAKSPGNTIAFSQLTGDYWQIWTMRPDGSNLKQVTKSLSDKRYPVWSKDGKALFFRTNDSRVYRVNLDISKEEHILPLMGLSGGVVPSPNGNELLMVRFNTQVMDNSNLFLTTLDGQGYQVLTRDMGLQYDPAWSFDGKKIAYIQGHGYQTHEIYIMDSDGSDKERLTNNKALEVLPAFSPDGKSIAYASDITGDFEIWLMDVDGSNKKRLTESEGLDTRPFWSPDGKQIIFVSNRSGTLQIWVMNSDGSDPKQVTTSAASIDPAWRNR